MCKSVVEVTHSELTVDCRVLLPPPAACSLHKHSLRRKPSQLQPSAPSLWCSQHTAQWYQRLHSRRGKPLNPKSSSRMVVVVGAAAGPPTPPQTAQQQPGRRQRSICCGGDLLQGSRWRTWTGFWRASSSSSRRRRRLGAAARGGQGVARVEGAAARQSREGHCFR